MIIAMVISSCCTSREGDPLESELIVMKPEMDGVISGTADDELEEDDQQLMGGQTSNSTQLVSWW